MAMLTRRPKSKKTASGSAAGIVKVNKAEIDSFEVLISDAVQKSRENMKMVKESCQDLVSR